MLYISCRFVPVGFVSAILSPIPPGATNNKRGGSRASVVFRLGVVFLFSSACLRQIVGELCIPVLLGVAFGGIQKETCPSEFAFGTGIRTNNMKKARATGKTSNVHYLAFFLCHNLFIRNHHPFYALLENHSVCKLSMLDAPYLARCRLQNRRSSHINFRQRRSDVSRLAGSNNEDLTFYES